MVASHSIREHQADVHVTTANQSVHGGPRVHDGGNGHGTHVLLRGGQLQRGHRAGAVFGVGVRCSGVRHVRAATAVAPVDCVCGPAA